MAIVPFSTVPASPIVLVDPQTRSPIQIPIPVSASLGGWTKVTFSGVVQAQVTSTLLLPAFPDRLFLCISNNSQKMVYLQFGSPAVYGRGIRLNAGGRLSLSGSELFLGEIYAVGITLTDIDILEGGI